MEFDGELQHLLMVPFRPLSEGRDTELLCFIFPGVNRAGPRSTNAKICAITIPYLGQYSFLFGHYYTGSKEEESTLLSDYDGLTCVF